MSVTLSLSFSSAPMALASSGRPSTISAPSGTVLIVDSKGCSVGWCPESQTAWEGLASGNEVAVTVWFELRSPSVPRGENEEKEREVMVKKELRRCCCL